LAEVDLKIIDNLKLALKGCKTIENIEDAIEIERSLPHGHKQI